MGFPLQGSISDGLSHGHILSKKKDGSV